MTQKTVSSTLVRVFFLAAAWTTSFTAFGQNSETVRAIEAFRERANAGVVGIVAGGVEGTYIRIAADLASVLDDGSTVRVVATIGKGSVQNISDILFLRGIDIGIVQSDALAFVRRERLLPGVDKNIQYIAKLYNEELHILARSDIARIQDLAGKKVNVDVKGSGTAMTSSLIFEALNIPVETVGDDQALALEKLKRGEIAALVYVAGKPARLFRDIKPEDGVRFLSVPAGDALLATYLPSQLRHDDYPSLVPENQSVETVAVGAVMAVYGWAPETDRYKKVARFTEALFDRFQSFQEAPRHPKWKEVNLAAQVPGWKRFAPAENWLRREAESTAVAEGSSQRKSFEAFRIETGASDPVRSSGRSTEAFFEEFLKWQARKAGRGG